MARTDPLNERSGRRDRARLVAVRKLMKSGLSVDDASRWCAAWEAEAARQSLHPDSEYFWHAGRGWIDAQRSFVSDERVDRRPMAAHPMRISR